MSYWKFFNSWYTQTTKNLLFYIICILALHSHESHSVILSSFVLFLHSAHFVRNSRLECLAHNHTCVFQGSTDLQNYIAPKSGIEFWWDERIAVTRLKKTFFKGKYAILEEFDYWNWKGILTCLHGNKHFHALLKTGYFLQIQEISKKVGWFNFFFKFI